MAYLSFELDYGTGFQSANPPKNHADTQLQLVWSNGVPSATIQAINYEWVGEEAINLNAYRRNGLSGGTGILEGVGLRIYVGTKKIFEGCIDTAHPEATWECDRVKCPIKKTEIDWFMETAQSFTFAHLRRLNIITQADYKKIPYTVNYLPDSPLLATMILTEFVLIKEFEKEVVDLTNLFVHASVGEVVGAATLWGAPSSIPALAASAIEIGLEIIYMTSLTFGIINNTKNIIDAIAPQKKYKYGMRAEDLILKGIQYMTQSGVPLTFSSTILRQGTYKDTTIIPAKRIVPKAGQTILSLFDRDANEVNSSKSYGYYDGTFKEFLDSIAHVFNAEWSIKNNTLYFEEKHSYNLASNYQLPDTTQPGYTFNMPDPHGTNLSECASVYFLKYQTDPTDLNTIHRYMGTSVEVTMAPISIRQQRNLLLKGIQRNDLQYAHAKRKDYLTKTEQAIDGLINVMNNTINIIISAINGVIQFINSVISIFNGNPQTMPYIGHMPINVLAGRIGWMELTNDTFEVPKIFIGLNRSGDWQIHPQNDVNMAAENLLRNYHGNNLLTRGNQWLLYGKGDSKHKIKFCLDDFITLQNTNLFYTPDGKKAKFDSILWKVEEDVADVKYRVNENYTNNLKETISIDGNI